MCKIGIIGFGSFGKFLAEKLDTHTEVRVYSYSGKGDKWKANLADVAACDYLLLAVPLNAYEETLKDLKPHLKPKTVIVDVCSVKLQSVSLIRKHLPNQQVVSTHPLFGPESAQDTLKEHVLVICPEDSDSAARQKIEKFARKLGLKVVKMSADEHDREMATVQGPTFFIAHALKDMKLHDQTLSTPSFKKLLALARLEAHHSDDLFHTMQTGNAHTIEMRRKFIEICERLDDKILN